MHNSIPSLDYPSRSAAVRALVAQGISHQDVAKAVGVDCPFVRAVLDKPEPVERAPARILHRAKVDPNHIVSGVLSKNVVASRLLLPASDVARGRTVQAMTRPRYRLQRADGLFLRLDAGGYVGAAAYGWIGFAHQLKRLQQLRPELAALTVITVLPPSRGAFNPTAIR